MGTQPMNGAMGQPETSQSHQNGQGSQANEPQSMVHQTQPQPDQLPSPHAKPEIQFIPTSQPTLHHPQGGDGAQPRAVQDVSNGMLPRSVSSTVLLEDLASLLQDAAPFCDQTLAGVPGGHIRERRKRT